MISTVLLLPFFLNNLYCMHYIYNVLVVIVVEINFNSIQFNSIQFNSIDGHVMILQFMVDHGLLDEIDITI